MVLHPIYLMSMFYQKVPLLQHVQNIKSKLNGAFKARGSTVSKLKGRIRLLPAEDSDFQFKQRAFTHDLYKKIATQHYERGSENKNIQIAANLPSAVVLSLIGDNSQEDQKSDVIQFTPVRRQSEFQVQKSIFSVAILLYSQKLQLNQNLKIMVSMLTKRLTFFRLLGQRYSVLLIKLAKMLVILEQKVIAKQGENLSCAYMVLQGSISLKGKKGKGSLFAGSVVGLPRLLDWQQSSEAQGRFQVSSRSVVLRVTRENLFRFLVRLKCDQPDTYAQVSAYLRRQSI